MAALTPCRSSRTEGGIPPSDSRALGERVLRDIKSGATGIKSSTTEEEDLENARSRCECESVPVMAHVQTERRISMDVARRGFSVERVEGEAYTGKAYSISTECASSSSHL